MNFEFSFIFQSISTEESPTPEKSSGEKNGKVAEIAETAEPAAATEPNEKIAEDSAANSTTNNSAEDSSKKGKKRKKSFDIPPELLEPTRERRSRGAKTKAALGT